MLRFVWQLNRLALVNVERTASRLGQLVDWLRLAARLAPAGALPAPVTRRRALDTRTAARAVVELPSAVLPRVVLVAAVATILAVHVALIVGAALLVPLLVGLGTGLGLGLHEAAHAAAPAWRPERTRRARADGRASFTQRSRRRGASVVAVGGPLAVAALGSALVARGSLTTSPAATIAGCPFAAHALALTVVGGDGRIACGL